MQTFTIRDLRDRTGELVRNAEEGHLSIISKHGTPVFVAVPFDDVLLSSGVQVGIAVQLFKEKTLGLSRAAKMSGMPLESFMELLGSQDIPVIDYDPDELEDELKVFDDK